MENRSFYNEILTEHNIHPEFKHDLADADIVLEGVNPSCGDDIFLKLKLDGDVIADGAFVGDGCAISQASADIMLGMILGKKKEEALKMGETFLKMIKGEATEEEIDSLEEASALRDIAHMPARVRRARLAHPQGSPLPRRKGAKLNRAGRWRNAFMTPPKVKHPPQIFVCGGCVIFGEKKKHGLPHGADQQQGQQDVEQEERGKHGAKYDQRQPQRAAVNQAQREKQPDGRCAEQRAGNPERHGDLSPLLC